MYGSLGPLHYPGRPRPSELVADSVGEEARSCRSTNGPARISAISRQLVSQVRGSLAARSPPQDPARPKRHQRARPHHGPNPDRRVSPRGLHLVRPGDASHGGHTPRYADLSDACLGPLLATFSPTLSSTCFLEPALPSSLRWSTSPRHPPDRQPRQHCLQP